jgi:hypothetical protein
MHSCDGETGIGTGSLRKSGNNTVREVGEIEGKEDRYRGL